MEDDFHCFKSQSVYIIKELVIWQSWGLGELDVLISMSRMLSSKQVARIVRVQAHHVRWTLLSSLTFKGDCGACTGFETN